MSCSMMKFSMSGKKRSPRRVKKKSPARKSPKRSKSPARKSPKRSARKSPKRSKSSARKSPKKADTRGCSLQHTKKYTQRASPAYPANQCCGDVMVGNDGKRWQSRPDSNGVCHWYKL